MLAAAAAVISLPAAALALPMGPDDGTLSVRHGRGVVQLRFRGAVIGRLAHGSVRIYDPVANDGSGADFWGCDHGGPHDLSDTTQICTGDDIRFRAIGGRYGVTARGSGIFLSAVGRGRVTLNGIGDPDLGILNDGQYSLNGGDYQSLPDDTETFQLAAPPGG